MVANYSVNLLDKLDAIYNRQFKGPKPALQRIVPFKAGNRQGIIAFSDPYNRGICGITERTQNILVLVDGKIAYASGPTNSRYSGIFDVRVEATCPPPNPFSPGEVTPLPITTVFVDFGRNTFIVANSMGQVFLGKEVEVVRKGSKGIKDVGSDYALDSGTGATVFDTVGALAALTKAWEIEKMQQESILTPHGRDVDSIKMEDINKQIKSRNDDIGRAARVRNDEEMARRSVELDNLLSHNQSSSAQETSVTALVLSKVDETASWSRSEFDGALAKIRKQMRSTRLTPDRVVGAVIDAMNRKREERE
jgi:hypothetical protein